MSFNGSFSSIFGFGTYLKLVMNWVPRSGNEVTDYISNLRDFDDWKVNPIIFQYLSKAWGPFTVDCLFRL